MIAFIIGFGMAGSRFARVCANLSIRVSGIADRDPTKLLTLSQFEVPKKVNFRWLWETATPDLLIVAANDVYHFDVLNAIKSAGLPFGRILCEKPIVVGQQQMNEVERMFTRKEISVNYLERFSPAVLRLREHLRQESLIIRRVDFTWSKYRVKDPRPSSIGVLSEMSHALDLSLFLSAIKPGEPFQVVGGYKIISDFTRDAQPTPDELSISLVFASGTLISGRSSYVRTKRLRRLELLLSTQESEEVVQVAELTLDDPHWDDDRLAIYSAGHAGNPELVFEFNSASADVPAERRHLSKLFSFVEANVADMQGIESDVLARLDDALYVQRIVEEAADRVGVARFRGFRSQ